MIDDLMCYQVILGNFMMQFFNVVICIGVGGVIGLVVNGQVVGLLCYVVGFKFGQVYIGIYVNNNLNINMLMKNMDNFVNNFMVMGKFDVGLGCVMLIGGVFYMSQNIVQDWYVNCQYSEVNGENVVLFDLFFIIGMQLMVVGQVGFNDNWGICCVWCVDLMYKDVVLFLQVGYEVGGFDLDVLVCYDYVSGKGIVQGGVVGLIMVVIDVLGFVWILLLVLSLMIEKIDYSDNYVSWLVGVFYVFDKCMSVFVCVSCGGWFNVDCCVLLGNFNGDGLFNMQGEVGLVNFLKQQ